MVHSCCSVREFLKNAWNQGWAETKEILLTSFKFFLLNNRLWSCNPLSLNLYSFGNRVETEGTSVGQLDQIDNKSLITQLAFIAFI